MIGENRVLLARGAAPGYPRGRPLVQQRVAHQGLPGPPGAGRAWLTPSGLAGDVRPLALVEHDNAT